mmetsp:Transcript_11671/g.37162  ORF Transcript_11671/g.37162 Transcript_11671/m.37162 type:complete len:152 (-) Transcript_11671:261-716(-)|eukprot:CAMPEP_0197387812 /NCGR_PEP_ID=MMETSP1165-20131217/733_1 /TAXON_ID=284809 /ORGANISM="Chrysocystis fragilis, Strain CCMP3189" /LENGTH=151 /DNA_ID=CAMNT_0042913145 /DNA_START=43 /DNA_END=498 /DNA_ORIENTATION=+
MAVLAEAQLVELGPLVYATIAYFLLFYTFMMFQSFTKFYLLVTAKRNKEEKGPSLRELKYGSNKKGLNLLSDRTFLNLFEQSVPFLSSVWLYGLVCDAGFAATLAYFYMAVRLTYPFVFRLGPPFIFFCTGPNYVVIAYCLFSAGFKIAAL